MLTGSDIFWQKGQSHKPTGSGMDGLFRLLLVLLIFKEVKLIYTSVLTFILHL